jgi:hypothetical protein
VLGVELLKLSIEEFVMPFPENERSDDLTESGLTSDEIRTLYYAQEPMMQSIVDTTAQLSERSRYIALSLLQTLAVIDTEHQFEVSASSRQVA